MGSRARQLAPLATVLLLLAPAGAQAQHDPAAKHTIGTTVVEREVTLPGGVRAANARSYNLSCADSGEYVFSGSASVDSISTGGPGVYDYIALTESRSTDVGSWRFHVSNDSIATATVTLRIVCVTARTPEYRFRFSQAVVQQLQFGRATCEEGDYPVQVGYLDAEPTLSFPLLRDGELRPAWRFAFGAAETEVSLRCLRAQTRIYDGHDHELTASFKRKVSRVRVNPTDATVRCPAGSKAVAPALDVRRKEVRTIQSRPSGRSWRFRLVALFKARDVAVGATCLVTMLEGGVAETPPG